MNSIAGGGSLLTFPTLVGLGYSPLVANVTNTVGVSTGNLGGTIGFRRELADQREALLRCGLCGAAGGACGSLLLLATPQAALRIVVAVLIGLASLLVLVQPRVAAWVTRRSGERPPHPWTAAGAVGIVSIYGGYFGAAMGVLLIAVLGVLTVDTLQRINALKTALTLVVNGASSVLFAIRAPVAWDAAGTLAVASLAGGFCGAALARRLPDRLMRASVVIIGVAAALYVALRR